MCIFCVNAWLLADWVVVLNTNVATSDIPCSSKPAALAKEGGSSSSSSCRVCGGPAEVSAACVSNPACVAFVMDTQTPGCGRLKGSSSGQARSQTHALYCHKARGAKCTGGVDRAFWVVCGEGKVSQRRERGSLRATRHSVRRIHCTATRVGVPNVRTFLYW